MPSYTGEAEGISIHNTEGKGPFLTGIPGMAAKHLVRSQTPIWELYHQRISPQDILWYWATDPSINIEIQMLLFDSPEPHQPQRNKYLAEL